MEALIKERKLQGHQNRRRHLPLVVTKQLQAFHRVFWRKTKSYFCLGVLSKVQEKIYRSKCLLFMLLLLEPSIPHGTIFGFGFERL